MATLETTLHEKLYSTLEMMIQRCQMIAEKDSTGMAQRREVTAFLNMARNYYTQPGNREGIVMSLYDIIMPNHATRMMNTLSKGKVMEIGANIALLLGGAYCFANATAAKLVYHDQATAMRYGLLGLIAAGSVIAWHAYRLHRQARRQRSPEAEQTITTADIVTVLDTYADRIQTLLGFRPGRTPAELG